MKGRPAAAALALAALALLLASAAEAHGTRFDRQVDAIPAARLLGAPAASLVDPVRDHRAVVIADFRHAASAGWALAQLAAFWWTWNAGRAAALRDTLRRRFRSRLAQRLAFGAALGLLAPLVALPFSFAGYRIGFTAGITEQTIPSWLLGYASRVALDAAIGALVVAVTFWLVDRTRLWYAVLAALIVVVGLGSVAVRAVVTPLPEAGHSRALSARAALFARDLDTHPVPVVVAPLFSRGTTFVGDVVGFGPTARIVVGEVTLDRATAREVDAVLAHAEARIARHDGLRLALAGTLLFLLTAALGVVIADRVPFRRDDDALSRLALLGTTLGVVALVTYPIYAKIARNLDLGAQHAAVRATGDPAAAVRFAVRRVDDELVPLCDRRYVRWYFATVPPPGSIIADARGSADPCH